VGDSEFDQLEFDNAPAKLIQHKIGLTADHLTKAELPKREQDVRRNKIEVRFRYNERGILYFTATHVAIGVVLAEREIDSFNPDGTPLQHGLEDELSRLLAHTIRPFADGSSNAGTSRQPSPNI
jgi:hypothetical protein